MFYSHHLRIISLGNTVLCLILLLLPRISVSALPIFGNGIFEYVMMNEYNWHIDANNQVIVDSVNVNWDSGLFPQYPCEAVVKKNPTMGRFIKCELSREIADIYIKRSYPKVRDLTRAEVEAFVAQTGPIGITGSANPASRAYFQLKVFFTLTQINGFLPRNGNTTEGGVPPTEVKPPLQCSISDGIINHGSLSAAEVEQHIAITTVQLFCNGSANALIRSENYVPATGVILRGPGTLYSTVTINGMSAERGVQVHANNTASIPITSVLKGKGQIIAGSYSGSIVLVVTMI